MSKEAPRNKTIQYSLTGHESVWGPVDDEFDWGELGRGAQDFHEPSNCMKTPFLELTESQNSKFQRCLAFPKKENLSCVMLCPNSKALRNEPVGSFSLFDVLRFFPRASDRSFFKNWRFAINLHMFTSSHTHIFSSSHLHKLTPSHLHIVLPSHLHIFTSAYLYASSLSLSFSPPLSLSPSVTVSLLLLFSLKAAGSADEAPRHGHLFAWNEVRVSKTGALRVWLVWRQPFRMKLCLNVNVKKILFLFFLRFYILGGNFFARECQKLKVFFWVYILGGNLFARNEVRVLKTEGFVLFFGWSGGIPFARNEVRVSKTGGFLRV